MSSWIQKITWYSINLEKLLVCLYVECTIWKSDQEVSCTYNSKNNKKYLGKNLVKGMKALYTANYKALVRQIEDTNKWKDPSQQKELILLKYL